MENILLPSLLSVDFFRLGKNIMMLSNVGCTHLHIDVMDGNFVPNYAIGIPIIKSINKNCKQILDCHLMCINPNRYIEDFKNAGADYITIHFEATNTPADDLRRIRNCGALSGLSIKLETPVEVLYPFIKEGLVDLILIMSVDPGFGEQKFVESAYDKIRKVRRYADEIGINLNIEVDGGVCESNIKKIKFVGANMIVVGSSIFKGNIVDNFLKLSEIVM